MVEERIRKFLASAGLLFPNPPAKTLQFGPSLHQTYKTLYLMILCKAFC